MFRYRLQKRGDAVPFLKAQRTEGFCGCVCLPEQVVPGQLTAVVVNYGNGCICVVLPEIVCQRAVGDLQLLQ